MSPLIYLIISAKHNKTNVRINKFNSRWCSQFFFLQCGEHSFAAGPFLAEIKIRCVSGNMRQKLLDRDLFCVCSSSISGKNFPTVSLSRSLPCSTKFIIDVVVATTFVRRRDIKDRVDRHFLDIRNESTISKSFSINDFPLCPMMTTAPGIFFAAISALTNASIWLSFSALIPTELGAAIGKP